MDELVHFRNVIPAASDRGDGAPDQHVRHQFGTGFQPGYIPPRIGVAAGGCAVVKSQRLLHLELAQPLQLLRFRSVNFIHAGEERRTQRMET